MTKRSSSIGIETTEEHLARAVVREAETALAVEVHARWLEQATGLRVIRHRRRSGREDAAG